PRLPRYRTRLRPGEKIGPGAIRGPSSTGWVRCAGGTRMKSEVARKLSRRQSVTLAVLAGASCRHMNTTRRSSAKAATRFFFTSQGKTAVMNADGTGLRYFDFNVPNQATWQPGPFLSDGRRVIFLSMEARRDGPGRPFEEYYTQTPTHIWAYDLEKDSLTEVATRHGLAVFYTPALLLGDERILVQVVRNKVGQIFSMNIDGTDAR